MCFLLNGCFESKPVSVASIGNAGSLGGPHFIRDMWVSDIYGGGANFAYGSVQGCCAGLTRTEVTLVKQLTSSAPKRD